MLVLTRKPGERAKIGNDIYVTVQNCKDGQVRLGFLAPKDAPILREELDRKPARPAMVGVFDNSYG